MKQHWKSIASLFAVCCSLSACSSYETRPIVDASGAPLAGSVAKLDRIDLGGVQQWILIRGNNANNPILLKVHGGPGQAEMATVGLNRLLEKDFVVVEWDQCGRLTEAVALKSEAVTFVSARVGEFTHIPRVVFCSGDACQQAMASLGGNVMNTA